MTAIVLGGYISVLTNRPGQSGHDVAQPLYHLGRRAECRLLAALLEQRQQVRYALLAETQTLSAIGTQHALRSLEAVATQIGGAVAPATHARVLLSRLITQEALLLAFNDTFSTFIVISLAGLELALFFRRARPQQR